MAVLTSRKSRLKQMAVHSAGARKALELANHPESFLSAVQLWISLLSLIIGSLGGESMGEKLAEPLANIPALAPYAEKIGFVIGFVVMLFVFGLIGELVPKRIGTLRPEKIAVVVAYPMQFFATLAKPIVMALSACTRWVMRLLRMGNVDENTITEEEIQMLVSEGHEQGVIDDDERNMMQRVMRLGDRTVESMMTPRTRITWLDATASFEENLAEMRETPYSRYPVFRGSDADVLGLLEVKSLLDRLDHGPARFALAQEHPAALAAAFGKASVAQDADMARHARLALAEHLRKLAHRKLHRAQQPRDAQPGRIAQRLEDVFDDHCQNHIKIFLYL
jgi:putative hemolysin